MFCSIMYGRVLWHRSVSLFISRPVSPIPACVLFMAYLSVLVARAKTTSPDSCGRRATSLKKRSDPVSKFQEYSQEWVSCMSCLISILYWYNVCLELRFLCWFQKSNSFLKTRHSVTPEVQAIKVFCYSFGWWYFRWRSILGLHIT